MTFTIPPISPIEAFFWDYDNTILETAAAHWNKHKTVLKRYGIQLAERHRQRIYENNGNQNWEWITSELGLKITKDNYLNEIDAEFKKYLMNLLMRPGVFEIIQEIEALKIPQAIVTNARRESAEPTLNEKQISSFMRFSLFAEDYEGRKPEPAPYLAGISKMEALLGTKLNPNKCIAVEDDPKGVISAYQAGLIVIQRKLKESDPSQPEAHYSCFHKDDFIKIVQNLIY